MTIKDGIKLGIGMQIGDLAIYMICRSILRSHYKHMLENQSKYTVEERVEAAKFLHEHCRPTYRRMVKEGFITEE